MRRLIPFIIICVLFPTLVKGQVGEARNDLAIGFNGDFALNKISFNPTIKQNFHQGFGFGFSARYVCEKYFSCLCALQAEVNYMQLGWDELIETSTDTYNRTMDYVQIPLLDNLGFGKERGGVKGFLVIGPQIGFCIGEREKRGGEWSDHTLYLRPNHIVEQYDMPVEKKFEYGLTGGLGMDVSTRSGHHFILEGRYYYGLSDIYHNSKRDTFGRSANGAIIAKLSYMFDIIKTKGI